MASSKVIKHTTYLDLKSADNGNGGEWVYAHRPNAKDVVVIVPIIDNKQVLFIIEKRPPMIAEGKGTYSIAVPAGLVGDEEQGETLDSAIEKELLQEAGLRADSYEIVAKNVASSPGCVSETYTIVLANLKEYKLSADPDSDGGVIVDRELVSIDNIFDWLREKQNNGYILTGQTLAALFYLFERMKYDNKRN